MSTSTTFNQTQRNAFENAIREKLREAQRTLDQKMTEARAKALQSLIEAKDGQGLILEIKSCRDNLETSEQELEAKGFEVRNDGDVRLSYKADDAVEKEYESMVAQLVRVEQSKVDAFKEALTNSWQIGNVEQAKAMVAALA